MSVFKWEYILEGTFAPVDCPEARCRVIRWHKTGERRWQVGFKVLKGLRFYFQQQGPAYRNLDAAIEAAEEMIIRMKLEGKL